ADLWRDRRKLGERLLLGFGSHPLARFDALFVCGHDVLDQSIHALLGGGREMFLDIEAAESLAHLTIERADDPLPARLHLLHAAQRLAVEAEVLALECFAQVR